MLTGNIAGFRGTRLKIPVPAWQLQTIGDGHPACLGPIRGGAVLNTQIRFSNMKLTFAALAAIAVLTAAVLPASAQVAALDNT